VTETLRPVWAEIDLKAIADNLKAIKAVLDPGTAVMAVVKANAYGHGLVRVAQAVEPDADRLGVALIEEALRLREAGLRLPIQLLSEPPAAAADEIVSQDLIAPVYSTDLARALSGHAVKQGRTVKIHLKIDTGMRRVGVRPEEALDLYRSVARLPGLTIEGVFTHFACAAVPGHPHTEKQLKAFLSLRPLLADIPMWHAANSAAALFCPPTRLDMVRIGIGMYGLQPAGLPSPVPLKPALTLKAKISWVQELQPGDGVSYGLTYKTKERTMSATLPIGYGDGYSRMLSNKGQVLIAGRRVSIIGNICMDQSLIELGRVKAAPGDEVVLIGSAGGQAVTAEEIASLTGTINYEVVCMINDRVPRVYFESAGP
jgi:alanine racemase